MLKLIIIVVGVSLLLAVGLIFLPSLRSAQASGKIEITPLQQNFGTVYLDGGLVKKTFEIRNVGEGSLKINSIWTSCMCTTATLTVNGKTSQEFGMHTSSALWSQEMAPGESGSLEVVFDPALHGEEGVGSIVRVVYLTTSDPEKSKAEARMVGEVVK